MRPVSGTRTWPAGIALRFSVATVVQRVQRLARARRLVGLTHLPLLSRPATGRWMAIDTSEVSDRLNLRVVPSGAAAAIGVLRGETRNTFGPNDGRYRTGATRSVPPPPPPAQFC